MNIAIVDRYSGTTWYSWRLAGQIAKILPNESTLYYYGPKSKTDVARINPDFKAVWTPWLYPFQIYSQALKDKIKIVHIQFEFVTFGSPYSSILLVPLLILLKLSKIKIIITVHGPIFPGNATNRFLKLLNPTSSLPPFLLKIYCLTTYKTMNKIADALVVHANIFKKWLAEVGIKRVCVISHGIDLINTIPTKSDSSTSAILCFGVVSPRKGLETLIDAFVSIKEELHGYSLIIAGGEPRYYKGYLDSLKAYAIAQGVGDRIIFTGYVEDNDIVPLFDKATLVISPYPFSISASGVLAQAMGFGKPIIATATEYSSEILEDGLDAILVPAGDSAAMAGAILNLCNNPVLRQNFAVQVREKSRKYQWARVAENTIILYENVLGERAI